MKVKITGSVFNGQEYLAGVVELPDQDALALINSGHAVTFEESPEPETDQSEEIITENSGEAETQVEESPEDYKTKKRKR